MPDSGRDATALAEALLELLPGILRLMKGQPPSGDRAPDGPGDAATPERRGQFRLLRILQKRGRLSMHELAGSMEVTPPTVTGMVKRLVEQGYVERVRDEADWRTVSVELTEQGREAVIRLHRERVAALRYRIEQLNEDERARLNEAIPVLGQLIRTQP